MDDDPLLDAAAALLKRGEPVTIVAVAAAACVARGTVYRRFADRDAILAALVASGRAEAGQVADPRERLLDAVGALIRRQGLAGTTLEDVAREAGVSPVTVYRRFKDRKGLLKAFVEERTPRRLARRLPPKRSGDLESGLLAISRDFLTFARDYRELFVLLMSPDAESAALLADLREGSTSFRETAIRYVNAQLPDPTGRTSAAFLGVLIAVAWVETGREVEEDARFVVSTFLRGVHRCEGVS